MLTDFGVILLFLIGGLVFFSLVMGLARWFRKSNPSEHKQITYESGELPVGNANIRFNNRFYIIALVFLLFEVELLFLFPWATVFGNAKDVQATSGLWGWFTIGEAFIFVLTLAIGLAYVWQRGYLDWVKPRQKLPEFESKVPLDRYEKLNEKYG